MSEVFEQIFIREQENSRLNLLLHKLIPFFLSGVSFLLAWYLLGFCNLNFPIIYDGSDATFMSWLIKRVMEGRWYFNSVYSGFPFGSTFLDFPISDTGNFIVFKILGMLTHSYVLTFNLYFLLGFSVTSVASYVVLNEFNISKIYAFIGAILFTFLPFHFLRLPHLFYTWYFNVPIFVWFAFKIFLNKPFFESKKWHQKNIRLSLLLVVLSCFGAYFTFFAILMMIGVGIAGSLKWKSVKNIISAAMVILLLIIGVVINVAPNCIYMYKNGRNQEVASRLPLEAELYGLKLTQMLLPQPTHRSRFFSNISTEYNKNFPLVTENFIASLGLVGSMGLITLLGIALGTPFFRFPVDSRLQLLAFLTLFLFLFATVGGLASLFALLITPVMRAWNRISVFVGFMSIIAFLICIEKLLEKIVQVQHLKSVSVCLGLLLLGFGVWDQTNPVKPEYISILKQQFLSDQHFVEKIEQLIPQGAIYQLPYMPFPEGAFINNLMSYDLFRGYLHSFHLHWSFGGTKGRPGDLFFRQLAGQPLKRQIKTIRTLGFNGIYLDRRGYLDHGIAIERELAEITGNKSKLVSEDDNLSFFLL